MKSIAATFLIVSSLFSHLLAADTAEVPLYAAKAVVYFKTGPAAATDEQTPQDESRLKLLQANLPEGDSSVTAKQLPHTSAFEIVVSSSTAEEAAKRANEISVALLHRINVPERKAQPLLIMNKALASQAVLLQDEH